MRAPIHTWLLMAGAAAALAGCTGEPRTLGGGRPIVLNRPHSPARPRPATIAAPASDPAPSTCNCLPPTAQAPLSPGEKESLFRDFDAQNQKRAQTSTATVR